MAQLAWVIGTMVLIGIVQFMLYRYLRERGDASPPSLDAETSPDRGVQTVLGDDAGSGGDVSSDGYQCPSCGTVNDPTFTFCRRCVDRIGA